MSTFNNKGKHLTTTHRIKIEKGLSDNASFASISRTIDKHPTTISKEVKKHRFFPPLSKPDSLLPCSLKKGCSQRFLCDKKDCTKLCKSCYDPSKEADCRLLCPDYTPTVCPNIAKAPYVCNSCHKVKRCLLQHAFYSAQQADQDYHSLLVDSRVGINQEPVDIALLDDLISPLLLNGQSLAHIYAHHGHQIPCSRRTLYNYIDKGIFTARNIDLRRKVRYKLKPRKQPTRVSLSAKEFRIDRTYEDFNAFLKAHPHTSVVEMDTVVGGHHNSQQVFLTLFFRNCSLMLIFLLKEKSQDYVHQVFHSLAQQLGADVFHSLFPIILTDNGTEFQAPQRLEFDKEGNRLTRIYYCHPNSSWQKGMIEKNHEYIRYVIPKGASLDAYTQADATLIMNHINSEARDSLNGHSPFKLSLLLLNNKLHKILGLVEISPDDVQLNPALLK
ncbi:MAG: IS30 family transposase [Coprobacillus sp.]